VGVAGIKTVAFSKEVNMEEQMMREKARRADLAVEVYDYLYKNTESFDYDGVGTELAYLLAAILKGVCIAAPTSAPIVKLLEGGFPKEHKVWEHIELLTPRQST